MADWMALDGDSNRMLVVRVVILQVKLGASFDIDSVFSARSAEENKTFGIEAFTSDIDEVSTLTLDKWDFEHHLFYRS